MVQDNSISFEFIKEAAKPVGVERVPLSVEVELEPDPPHPASSPKANQPNRFRKK